MSTKCRRCGKDFQSSNRNVLYCSQKCRKEALRARREVHAQLGWINSFIKNARKGR